MQLLLNVPVFFQFGENFNRGTKFTVDTYLCNGCSVVHLGTSVSYSTNLVRQHLPESECFNVHGNGWFGSSVNQNELLGTSSFINTHEYTI